MSKFWRRTHIYDPSRPHHENIARQNDLDAEDNIDEFLHNVREGHKRSDQPVYTPQNIQHPVSIMDSIRNGIRTVKNIAIGLVATAALTVALIVVAKIVETYNEASAWISSKMDPSWVEPAAPKKAIAAPAKKAAAQAPAPAPVSVFKKLPEGIVGLPGRTLYIDAVSDMISYTMAKSGSKRINQDSLDELAEDVAASGQRTFARGIIDNSTGETLEVIMGAYSNQGRKAVLCLGSAKGIRSVTFLHMIPNPQNIAVIFANSVTSSTGQSINLTEIANRSSQCGNVMIELRKIDRNIKSALN